MVDRRGIQVWFGVVAALALTVATAHAAPKGKGKKPAAAKHARPAKVDVKVEAAALVGGDATRAETAAKRLGSVRNTAATQALLGALATGLAPKVAVAALDGLAAHPTMQGYDIITTMYLSHRDARVRAAAVRAVGALDDSRAVEKVLAALHDLQKNVRAAAVAVVGERRIKRGIEPMMALLKKGDEAPAEALAAMADPDMAMSLGELIGVAPDAVLARCLGLVLMRKEFKPEGARVQVVRTLGKIPSNEAIEQLTSYIDSVPENPPRQSRREAESILDQRLGGGN